MLITFRKIFLILIISIFSASTLVFGQSYNQCGKDKFGSNSLFKKKIIKLIDIKLMIIEAGR